jgi:hypothetical protein
MNTPVSFELAKLLKEKGFNLKVINFYDYERLSTPFDKQRQVDGLINYNPINWNSNKVHYTSAPTIAEVVMWLYEKHEIWIGVICDVGNDLLFTFKIYSTKIGEERCIVNGNMYESLTEAHEAAIKYTLNNLI